MANYVIAANQESPFLTSLDSLVQTQAYLYDIQANFPNGSIDVLYVNPNVAPTGNGSDITFELPRTEHFLTDAVIECTITVGTGTETHLDLNSLGNRFFSDITFRTHSHAIHSIKPEGMIARAKALPSEQAYKHNQLTKPSSTLTAGATSVKFYVPIYLPFFERTSSYFPIRFLERAQLTARVNTKAGMGMNSDLGAVSVKLWCKFRTLQSEAYNAYLSSNLKPNSLLNMIANDYYVESNVSITSGASSATMDWKCPHPVYATHFYLYDSTKNLGPTTSMKVNTVSVRFAGKPLLEDVPVKTLQYFNSRFSRGDIDVNNTSGALTTQYNDGTTASQNDVYTIYWSELPNRTFNSHCVALSNINQPQLELSFTTLASSNMRVACVHEYFKYVQLNPVDGQVSVLNSL